MNARCSRLDAGHAVRSVPARQTYQRIHAVRCEAAMRQLADAG